MGFYTGYKTVFDNLKTVLEAKTSIRSVVVGEVLRLSALPMAVVNPEPADVSPSTVAHSVDVAPAFSVIVVVRESEPNDWFEEVIKVMGDVVDAVLADPTLNGAVRTCYLTGFAPGEVKFQNKLFYGGILRFTAHYRHIHSE